MRTPLLVARLSTSSLRAARLISLPLRSATQSRKSKRTQHCCSFLQKRSCSSATDTIFTHTHTDAILTHTQTPLTHTPTQTIPKTNPPQQNYGTRSVSPDAPQCIDHITIINSLL